MKLIRFINNKKGISNKVIIITDNLHTIAQINTDYGIFYGISKCHTLDTFDLDTGINIAVGRACNRYFDYKIALHKSIIKGMSKEAAGKKGEYFLRLVEEEEKIERFKKYKSRSNREKTLLTDFCKKVSDFINTEGKSYADIVKEIKNLSNNL